MLPKILPISGTAPLGFRGLSAHIQAVNRLAPMVFGQDLVLVWGPTGAGKSVFCSWVNGKTFRSVRIPGALEKGVETEDPVSPIGNRLVSETLMPVLCPASDGRILLDCAGTNDTRSWWAELGNAYATTKIGSSSRRISGIVILITYAQLTENRAERLKGLVPILDRQFGSMAAHLSTLVLGVNKVPAGCDLGPIQEYLRQDVFPEEIRDLANRLFILDPLGQHPHAISKESFEALIRSLSPINQPQSVLSATLSTEAELAWQHYLNAELMQLTTLIRSQNWVAAETVLQQLAVIRAIPHPKVSTALSSAIAITQSQLGHLVDTTASQRLDQIEGQLKQAQAVFVDVPGLEINPILARIQDRKSQQTWRDLEEKGDLDKLMQTVSETVKQLGESELPDSVDRIVRSIDVLFELRLMKKIAVLPPDTVRAVYGPISEVVLGLMDLKTRIASQLNEEAAKVYLAGQLLRETHRNSAGQIDALIHKMKAQQLKFTLGRIQFERQACGDAAVSTVEQEALKRRLKQMEKEYDAKWVESLAEIDRLKQAWAQKEAIRQTLIAKNAVAALVQADANQLTKFGAVLDGDLIDSGIGSAVRTMGLMLGLPYLDFILILDRLKSALDHSFSKERLPILKAVITHSDVPPDVQKALLLHLKGQVFEQKWEAEAVELDRLLARYSI